MSARLESLLDADRRAECLRNDEAMRTVTRAELALNTRRFARTAGEAFKDATYSDPIEPHIAPPLWQRITLFFRRRFS